MNALDVSRWQFGITTVDHFLFVPLTIGLAPLVAIMQTVWHRTGNPAWYRPTKFFGKVFLIDFALGVVTGIVQEFQFGMNWSAYSRSVGDVFGAPLAPGAHYLRLRTEGDICTRAGQRAGRIAPFVVLYQSWTYWGLRQRVARRHIPVALAVAGDGGA